MKTCSQCQVKYPDVLEFCPRDGSPLPPSSTGASAASYDPMIGNTIDGRYQIEARLGEGGMGMVYKARHVLIDKPVAIKILRKEAAQDASSVQRFIQEAKSASKINHSNIVDITDFGVLPDGHAYFVMEFLEGQTLAQAIAEGPLDPVRVCVVGAQMARGLHAAHQKGIVHRDLKPENVFLLEREGQQDVVKIVDFGIAKIHGAQRLTQVGMVLGTPEYMSPEQATGAETDHRVDQYALGCMMYEMLTGVVPFLGERPAQTLTKHVFEPVVPPSKRKADLMIPENLEQVVLRTLGKKPAERFPSMRELEQELQRVEADVRQSRASVDPRATAVNNPPVTSPPPPSEHNGVPTQAYQQQSYAPSGIYNPPAPMAQIPQTVLQGGSGFIPASMIPMASGVVMTPFPAGAGYSGPVPAGWPQAAPRPTRESAGVGRSRRNRTVLVAVAAALLAAVALAIIFYMLLLPPPMTPVDQPPPRGGASGTPPRPRDPGVEPVAPQPVAHPPVRPPEPARVEPAKGGDVQILIRSTPLGARVYVNGESKGKTPYPLTRPQGATVQLELRKPGYRQQVMEFLVDEKTREVNLTLVPGSGRRGGSKERNPPTATPKNGGGGHNPLPNPKEIRDPFSGK